MFYSPEIAHQNIPEIVYQVDINDRWFENLPEADLYCEAVIQASQGNRDKAEQIAQAIQYQLPAPYTPKWKEPIPETIDDFFNKLFALEARRLPQGLSGIGILESLGLRGHNAYLNNLSIEAMQESVEEKKALFALLPRYSLEGLTEDQKITYAIVQWKIALEEEGEKFLFHDYRISQTFVGILAELIGTLTQHHEIKQLEDLDNFLLRLARIPVQLSQTMEVMELQKKRGIVPPRFAIQKVVKILKNYFNIESSAHPLYVYLAEQTLKIELPCREEKLLLARQIIENLVSLYFRAFHAYCEELLKSVESDHGVWALPDGDAYYACLLKAHTTTNLTPGEVHRLGLQEVERVEKEMRSLLANEGIADDSKSVGQLMRALSEDPEFYYPDTSEGRQQCLADFEAILERSRKELWPLFGKTPKIPVSILPVPKHEEEGMPSAYYHLPSLDGSRGGVFYVNLHRMQDLCRLRMETLAVHEAEPGHHFQLSIQMESPLHLLRKLSNFTSYAEGWALYAEKLAYENGFYSSPFQQLGHLQDELLRAVRLVVDTGIHNKRWSKDQAVHYMEEKLGSSHEGIVSEVERYFVAPGQACAYKIGQLKILALRQKAREALGEKFDIREFHDAILRCGSVPLTVLEEIVDQYILRD